MAQVIKSVKFPFDVKKPIKSGYLQKQGKTRNGFKRRFFVLYKGYLVYYIDDEKWRFDTTKGDTLGSRTGAIRLKGGRVAIPPPHGVPKECHYSFLLHVPDPGNKRNTFLLDSTSDEERDAWIAAIDSATPQIKEPAAKAKK